MNKSGYWTTIEVQTFTRFQDSSESIEFADRIVQGFFCKLDHMFSCYIG
jgi:hypothetical protein